MSDRLIIENLVKRYTAHGPAAVNDVSLEVAPGEIVALLGPSGCGKTTTLRCVAGFERPTAGRIVFQDRLLADAARHVPPEKRNIGFVFQDYALFPHLDVADNVAFGIASRRRRRLEAEQLLQRFELAELARRKPHELSGGQQQRVAVARALAAAPRLVLLDEPFSNLDARLRQTARQQVRELLTSRGTAAILVTHDQEEACGFADRIAVMSEGKIVQEGAPCDVYCVPQCSFVASFLGNANLLRVHADGGVGQSVLGKLALDRHAGGERLVSLRPESLRISDNPIDGVAGRVIGREFLGAVTRYRIRVAEQDLLVVSHESSADRFDPNIGNEVYLTTTHAAVVLDEAL